MEPLGARLVRGHRDVVVIFEEGKTQLHYLSAPDIRRNLSGGTPNLVCWLLIFSASWQYQDPRKFSIQRQIEIWHGVNQMIIILVHGNRSSCYDLLIRFSCGSAYVSVQCTLNRFWSSVRETGRVYIYVLNYLWLSHHQIWLKEAKIESIIRMFSNVHWHLEIMSADVGIGFLRFSTIGKCPYMLRSDPRELR